MGEHYVGSQAKGFNQPYGYPMNCNYSRVLHDMSEEDRKCLEERKYWCFMLSRKVQKDSSRKPDGSTYALRPFCTTSAVLLPSCCGLSGVVLLSF
ncbi:hypothetical protein ANCDUO_14610 [Ancylostoma duodenale]|uniref:Uncharacterized protein n=1 Tax=Ancylostoma duodenale TaxID=51022 RepID=A0A0C2CZL0_9BILA|nr:hypothetical protein ANCDUO_14610 [Ancylostoma duodenale]